MTHHFVDLPGLRMHVAEAGNGEPVVMLHGFPQHWWEWRGVIPAIAQHYRVICPDLRGFGWTDAPADGYTGEQFLDDVVALLDKLQLGKVHLLTHDWAGLVAYQLCLRRPELVRDHLSLSIPPPYFEFDPRFVLAMLRKAWFNLILPVPGLGPLALRRGRLPGFMLRGGASNPGAFSEADLEIFVSRFREPGRATAGSALYRHFIQPEAVRILRGAYRGRRLTTPTRVIVGADDPIIRPEFVHGYEQYVDDLEVDYVDNASHFVADDRPELVAERALQFFKEQ